MYYVHFWLFQTLLVRSSTSHCKKIMAITKSVPSLQSCNHKSLNLQNCALQIPSLIDLDMEESEEKTEKVRKGGMREGNGSWCCLLLLSLITLILIKNWAGIINLPKQACILNEA